MPPKKSATTSKTKKEKVAASATSEATPIMYPELKVKRCVGKDALTATDMKEFLDYEVERPATDSDKGTSFGEDYMGVDYYGRKFRCKRNVGNRPFVPAKMKEYGQKVLCRQWRLNGETMVIGKTGRTLSIQHRGTGLIWAEDEYNDPKRRAHWAQYWPDGPPTMEGILVLGAEEDPETVRTIDTGKPRDLTDAMCTEIFQDIPNVNKRKDVCRVAEYSIRRIWDRTGAKEDPWTPIICNEEAMAFYHRHAAHLEPAIRHILEENKGGGIAQYLSPGNAAALCYLMGCSGSTGPRDGTNQLVEYVEGGRKESAGLTWENWERAQDFFAEIHSGKALTKHLNAVRRPSPGHDVKGGEMGGYVWVKGTSGGSALEKINVLIRAWNLYKENKRITSDLLELEYEREYLDFKEGDPELTGVLDSCSVVSQESIGGIDIVRAKEATEEPAEEIEEAEIEERKEEVLQEKLSRSGVAEDGTLRLPDVKAGNAQLEQIEFIHQQYPDSILLFKLPNGYAGFNDDARALARHKIAVKTHPQVKMIAQVPFADFPALYTRIVEAGQKVVVSEKQGDEWLIRPYVPEPTEEPKS